MIGQKVQDAFNEQLNAETYSAYLYWSMSAYFESQNLKGFANWMICQVQEEMAHAMKFYRFLNERGGRVVLSVLAAPPTEWDSPLAAFEATLAHEQHVTGLVNKLVDLAVEESDHATNNFLQWFVAEQVEEEDSADQIVQKLKLAGDAPQGLLIIDRELAQRSSSTSA